MVDLALKNLLHDRLRFAVTLCGIAFAVALVLVQVGLFFGLLYNATSTIEHLPAQLWVTSRNARNVDFGQRFPESYVQRVRGVPGVARADNLIVMFSEVRLPTGGRDGVTLYGLEDFKAWNFPWDIESGDVEELRRGANFMVDGSADRRFGKPLKEGEYWDLLERRFKIVGRTRDAKSFTTTPLGFMNFYRVQALMPVFAGNTSYIIIRVSPEADVAQVQAAVQERLPYLQVLTREDWSERTRSFWLKSTGLGFSIFVTVLLGCLVGVVIVSQTLYASTLEHLKEFGMLKAMGGTNWDIYRILGRQAVICALIGFSLGLGATLFARWGIGRMGMKVMLPQSLLFAVFLGTLVLCLVAGLASFHKVARIDPALVFRGL